MRILVVGAGAIGGYFGGRMAQAGRDVTFLVRPKRAEAIRKNGLVIKSPSGDVKVDAKVITAEELKEPYDAILLSVKAWSLEDAMNDFAPAVGEETMILPVLNGMQHMETIDNRFGAHALIGGVCKAATALDAEGNIVQSVPVHFLGYGERDGQKSERIEKLHEAMQGCLFDTKLSTDITREMWEKWIFIATLSGATCLMRGSIGQILSAPAGADFLTNLFDEITEVVRKAGVTPSKESVQSAENVITEKGSKMTSSMYRDLQKGYRVEREQIIDDLIAHGKQGGVQTPLLNIVSTHLAVYSSQLQ